MKQDNPKIRKKRFKWYLILLLAGVFLAAIGQTSGDNHSRKEDPMESVAELEKEAVRIPSMDAAQPKVFQTASFGLG